MRKRILELHEKLCGEQQTFNFAVFDMNSYKDHPVIKEKLNDIYADDLERVLQALNSEPLTDKPTQNPEDFDIIFLA